MSKNKNPYAINWSEKDELNLLIKTRENLWKDKSLAFLLDLLNLKENLKIADIGCGIGYLGSIMHSDWSEKTEYTGIDLDDKLLHLAHDHASSWKEKGQVSFVSGNVYHLPLEDNHYDLTICQTLMMHLHEPDKALAEMIRITKNTGMIVCIEPDNTFNGNSQNINGFLEYVSPDDYAVMIKVNLYRYKGKIQMGTGDFSIGNKIPFLMNQAGLKNIRIYNSPQITNLLLPGNYEPTKTDIKPSNQKNPYNKHFEKEVMAGGGTQYLITKYKKIFKKYRYLFEKNKEQYQKGEYYCCNSYAALKITIGTKV